jgi:DNA-binding NarL/FixJ family response regulator
MTIRILVADDQELARAGVKALLHGTDIEVAAQAVTAEQAVKCAATQHPDLVLLDVRMQNQSAFEALRQIRRQRPNLPVLIFTVSDSLADLIQAHQLGVMGYLCKTASREELVDAIHRAAAGQEAWSRQQRRKVRSPVLTREVADDGTALTPRELDVLKQVSEGLANEEIAERLDVSVETIKHHVKQILSKIGLDQRVQAALWAVRHGLA